MENVTKCYKVLLAIYHFVGDTITDLISRKLRQLKLYVRFEAFTAVTMKNVVLWDVALCRSCVNRRFGGTYRLHLQGKTIRERGNSVSRWLQTESSKNYTAPHPRRRHSSVEIMILQSISGSTCISLHWNYFSKVNFDILSYTSM
jgi:hypothetical protein